MFYLLVSGGRDEIHLSLACSTLKLQPTEVAWPHAKLCEGWGEAAYAPRMFEYGLCGGSTIARELRAADSEHVCERRVRCRRYSDYGSGATAKPSNQSRHRCAVR